MVKQFPTPAEILALALAQAVQSMGQSVLRQPEIIGRIELIARNTQNRAGARLILACALAKVHNPTIDIRKPYTEIGNADAYSGRTYDENYITEFILAHNLPCNSTTAFLTPALRNRNTILTPTINLVGRPADVYQAALQLLDDVYTGNISASDLLTETIRWLLVVREEKQQRMHTLLTSLKSARGETSLSAEGIVTLIEQHLKLKKSSRLPVLVVAAAYYAAEKQLGEQVRPMYGHTTADRQTGALGDLEISLVGENNVVTCYEMKTRRVLIEDIEQAIIKVAQSTQHVDNYIFITTVPFDREVQEYATAVHDRTGMEVVIMDCIGFLRHFLHLFYRLRVQFLESYQQLLLSEPDSAVNQPLKEAFLAMRQAAESGE